MRPRKEFFFSSDVNPRICEEDRAYLARLIRGYRRNPDQFRVWREGGEIRTQVRSCPDVVATIRTRKD